MVQDTRHLDLASVGKILIQAKRLARRYRMLTGKPLGITGEVGEYEAARLLRLNLCDARQRGHDAELKRNGRIQKFEIKTRLIPRNHNPGQRMSGIKLEGDWHAVLLVILDEEFEPVSIYQASRQRVAKEIL